MSLKLSEETTDLLLEVKDFSDIGLANINDVGTLIELTIGRGDKKQFMDIIFTARYIQGLKNVLNKGITVDVEAENNIRAEFMNGSEKFHKQLADLISSQDETIKRHFDERYLQMSQEGMFNLMGLADDLAIFKRYFNRHDKSEEKGA